VEREHGDLGVLAVVAGEDALAAVVDLTMAAAPRDAPRHAGQVVRRVLLRRNIAINAETAQLVADAVQAALQPAVPPGHRADARVAPPRAASRCSDPGTGAGGRESVVSE
jgi:hypothetical protein